ncbi:uncharacterized protein N7458_002790 [Penicillium daleae]|uniref:Uncharacterized protein n=1 Tax=Penicillium daleae TaxID=63821 RepID=A0AAD6CFA4_9EURO|nr:uncharacterized protein N7458_002790 [Penicillium daleae]KAJ5461238.1 hypothetical protein N7458_002790 [Penicillium daleae]
MSDIPLQSTRRPTARFARRYGSTFSSFDHLANVSLCSQKLRRVEIDCRFRLSKTKWGVLGPAENQAGILYMDFSFSQSKHCRLSSASVWVSLEDPAGVKDTIKSDAMPTLLVSTVEIPAYKGRSRSGLAPKSHETERSMTMRHENEEYQALRSMCLPRLTHDFGPRQLTGEPTKVTTKRTRHLTPEVKVLGNGGGGLGWDDEQSIEQNSRWTFTGSILQGSKLRKNPADIVYRTLKWELSEDEFQPQTTHCNTIQTAFTLEHNEKPFIIRIEIQGKLESKHDRMKDHVKRLLKFPSDLSKGQGVSLTMVNPRREKATRRLDAIVQGIPFDMERLNLEAVPPQLPTMLPISFQDTTPFSRDDSATTSTAVEENNTGLSATDHMANARFPNTRVSERISSFPQAEETTAGEATINEKPLKTGNCVTSYSARNRSDHSSFRNPSEQRHTRYKETTFKLQNENHKNMAERSQVEEMPASETILEPVEDKLSREDLNDLVSQLAQFPFLLRIFLWVISMMSYTQNKTPRKILRNE